MEHRYIEQFDAVLLDMGETFMFEADRFESSEDIAATYRSLGGNLSEHDAVRLVLDVLRLSIDLGRDPSRFDDYPTVPEFLHMMPGGRELPASERKLLEEVFLIHEMGSIPSTHAEELHRLRRLRPLGLVSNITSRSGPFHDALRDEGIHDLFDAIVFSSDYRAVKPSPILFRAALEQMDVSPADAVYVGDNQMRDVGGAKALGMAAVWVSRDGRRPDRRYELPDVEIRDLRELAEL